MVYFIVVIDSKRGMANEQGIPWKGKTPKEVAYFRANTIHHNIMMGYGTYIEFTKPLSDRRNLVASTQAVSLLPGFELVLDAREFLMSSQEDVWVIGGAELFTSTLDLADELYITQLEGNFNCTKFFPEFEQNFVRISQSEIQEENGIRYRFQIWKRKD
jgi:dihydrofolate reductase